MKKNKIISRDVSITIPMSKEEKNKVQEKANEMGVTMSSFIRIVLKEFIKKDE